MTDRELLELAAKAAGFGAPKTGWICWTESEYPIGSKLCGALWNGNGHMDTAELWNPLSDDGDALRLAMKLGFHIKHWAYACQIEDSNGHEWPLVHMGECEGDICHAARRSIVIAAAEIGKGV